jgi:TolB-like protein/tetratricopeptide (TPR) repeat protein
MKPEDYKPDIERIVAENDFSDPSEPPELLERLRRRKIVQWGVAYLAAAWLILQVLDFFRENFGWSPAPVRAATVILGAGFLAALVFAWYHGEKGRQRLGGVEASILAGVLVLAGVGLTLVTRVDDTQPLPVGVGPAGEPEDERVTRGANPSVTVAIMPFENLSIAEDDAYLAEGLALEIGSQLSKVADLRLISRSAVLAALTDDATSATVGRNLGAGRVLEGVVRIAGDRVRITAELTDVTSLEQVWAETYEREVGDLFAMQSEVALAIADGLEANLTTEERSRIETRATEDLAARRLYERQRSLFGSRPDDNALGIELLKEAIALDSAYSDAYARLGWRYAWVVRSGDRGAEDSARVYAERAVQLDPESALAHYGLASAIGAVGGGGVARAYRRALALDPSNVAALMDLSWFLTMTGNLDEAVDYGLRAVKVAPTDPLSWWHLTVPLLALRWDDRTEAVLEHAIGLSGPDASALARLEMTRAQHALLDGRPEAASELAFALLGRFGGLPEPELAAAEILFFGGDVEAVWPLLEPHLERAPAAGSPWYRRSVRLHAAYVLRQRGETDRANELLDEVLTAASLQWEGGNDLSRPALETAGAYAIRGDRARTHEWLQRTYEKGFRWYRHLAVDPLFEFVRGDAEFDDLLTRMAAEVERAATRAERDGIGRELDEILAVRP